MLKYPYLYSDFRQFSERCIHAGKGCPVWSSSRPFDTGAGTGFQDEAFGSEP